MIGIDHRRIVFSNHAVETVFGWKPEEVIGKTMSFVQDRKAYTREARKIYRKLKEAQTYSAEYTYRKKDGSDVICLTSFPHR